MTTRRSSAFSLIEIMVAVTLLAVIIISLVAMFNQTQRAMTLGLNQVDVLSGGRTLSAILETDLAQMGARPGFSTFTMTNLSTNVWPISTTESRTNIIATVFFRAYSTDPPNLKLTSPSNSLITYAVATDANGVGTLYRWCQTSVTNEVTNALLDGIVDFQFRVLDSKGQLLLTNNKVAADFSAGVSTNKAGAIFIGPENYALFTSPAIPPTLDLEFGVLEKHTLDRYNSFSNNLPLALHFLTNQAPQLHIFRQRITMRVNNP